MASAVFLTAARKHSSHCRLIPGTLQVQGFLTLQVTQSCLWIFIPTLYHATARTVNWVATMSKPKADTE